MCGLVTIIQGTPTSDLDRVVDEMVGAIAHRGPDDRQVVTLDDLGAIDRARPRVGLGHVRLAIQDLSEAGRQPMRDDTGRRWLSYNGEIYNFPELSTTLRSAGVEVRSTCDTEVLFHLLSRCGIEALRRLDGMFAFVFLDFERRTVVAVRDRFGIKPLYYWRAPDGSVVFASEIKALTAHPAWRARMNGPRAHDYLRRGLIDHTPETLFEGVHQVPAGHLISIDLDAPSRPLTPTAWYAPEPAAPMPAPAQQPARFRTLLAESVMRRLRADVDVASCLSGGLDSSAIVCLAGEARRARGDHAGQATFTARTSGPLDEWAFAQLAAERAGATAHEVWPRGDALLRRLEELVWTQDEPFGSPSIYAQHCVFGAAAAQGIKVMLDGQGADELLGGYPPFLRVRLLELMRHGRVGAALHIVRRMRAVYSSSRRTLVAQTIAAAMPAGALRRFSPVDQMRIVIDHEAFGGMPPDPFHAMTGRARGMRAFSLDMIARASLPMLLHWEDRNSMAHSIEARVPFLSHPLVEFCLGLPSEARIDGEWTKVILRRALHDTLPAPIRDRRDKIAFATPDAAWLQREHRDAASEMLESALDTCGRLVTAAGRASLRDVLAGRRPWHPGVFRVMCFGAWMRRFAVG